MVNTPHGSYERSKCGASCISIRHASDLNTSLQQVDDVPAIWYHVCYSWTYIGPSHDSQMELSGSIMVHAPHGSHKRDKDGTSHPSIENDSNLKHLCSNQKMTFQYGDHLCLFRPWHWQPMEADRCSQAS